jgi:hypothetical protein
VLTNYSDAKRYLSTITNRILTPEHRYGYNLQGPRYFSSYPWESVQTRSVALKVYEEVDYDHHYDHHHDDHQLVHL